MYANIVVHKVPLSSISRASKAPCEMVSGNRATAYKAPRILPTK